MNNLDNFFKYLLSTKIKRDLNLVREYPKYEAIIKSYKNKLEESKYEPIIFIGSSRSQIYSLPFDLAGGDIFELKINIDKLNNILNEEFDRNNFEKKDYKEIFKLKINSIGNEDVAVIKFLREFLKVIIDEEDIDKEYAKTCINKKEPILCGDFTGFSPNEVPFFIMDGNHKAFAKVKSGQDNIEGVLVSRNISINSLMTEQDKVFIKIYNNINYILSYRSGQIFKDKIEKFMYEI